MEGGSGTCPVSRLPHSTRDMSDSTGVPNSLWHMGDFVTAQKPFVPDTHFLSSSQRLQPTLVATKDAFILWLVNVSMNVNGKTKWGVPLVVKNSIYRAPMALAGLLKN